MVQSHNSLTLYEKRRLKTKRSANILFFSYATTNLLPTTVNLVPIAVPLI